MFSNKLKTLNKILNLRRTKAFRLIDDSQIEKVINYFKPTLTNHKLIRIGEKNDGGYLIPDILKEIKYCFSAGVGHTNEFETDLNKYEIKSFLADYSIDQSIRNLHEFDFRVTLFCYKLHARRAKLAFESEGFIIDELIKTNAEKKLQNERLPFRLFYYDYYFVHWLYEKYAALFQQILIKLSK